MSFQMMIGELQHDLGLSSVEMASALAVEVDLLTDWQGGTVVPEEVLQRLLQLVDLNARLHETFLASGVPRWLRSESRYLGGETPVEALLSGEFYRVEAALGALDSGVFI